MDSKTRPIVPVEGDDNAKKSIETTRETEWTIARRRKGKGVAQGNPQQENVSTQPENAGTVDEGVTVVAVQNKDRTGEGREELAYPIQTVNMIDATWNIRGLNTSKIFGFLAL